MIALAEKSMQKIKPRKIILDFLYMCPSCEGEHYATYDEVKKIGKIVLL